MKTAVECMTGLTVELDDNDKWIINPKGKEGINKRFTKLDGVHLFLHPESSDLKFEKVKSMIETKINNLNDGVAVTKQIKDNKIEYLKKLADLFDQFARQDVIQDAPMNFGRLVKRMIPNHLDATGIEVLANLLYSNCMLESKLKEFLENWKKNKNRECFSLAMTTNESLAFFCDINNYASYNPESGRNEMVVYMRDSIVRILSMQRNSSNCERLFKKVHLAAKDSRPRILVDTIQSEIIVTAIRSQPDIFDQLQIPKIKRKWLISPQVKTFKNSKN